MKILVTESDYFSWGAAAILRELGSVHSGLSESFMEKIDPDVLWVRFRLQVTVEIMELMPALKYICSATTGTDHIDLTAAKQRGIEVLHLDREDADYLKEHVWSVAEHTVGLMLRLLRTGSRADPPGHELHGKRVVLLGDGRVSMQVRELLMPWGCKLPLPDWAGPRLDYDEPSIYSEHRYFTAADRDWWTVQRFHKLARGSWFVNTARGGFVDNDALIEVLDSGHLAGAALDVVDGQIAQHPKFEIAEHPNLIVTGHVGGWTYEGLEKTEVLIANKLASRSTAVR